MRRLIAYITLAVSMLIAVGVAATPVITKLNGGREFSSGREIVFNISTKDDTELDKDKVYDVAAEMRKRLDNFQVEDYSIKVQGDDTIVASFDVPNNEFDYVAKYLCFSGRDFSISGKEESTVKNADFDSRHDLFKIDEAHIERKSDAKVPVIVIPVTDEGKKDIDDLIKELNPEEENTEGITKAAPLKADDGHDHEGEGESEPEINYIYLWSNYENGDSYDMAEKNPLIREKILMSFDSKSIYYEEAKEDEPAISFICATGDENGQLDLSALKDDNIRANYLLNMLQASEYDVDVVCPTRNITSTSVDYLTNSSEVSSSIEYLYAHKNNHVVANVLGENNSKILVATLVAIVIVSLLLVVYYKISALAMIATTLGTLFISLISFSSMSVLFNIPAVVGFIALFGGVLFGEIVYVNKFKEEVYKGRAIKKANQEASKKSNLLTLDSAIVLAFTGLMMYALGGAALKSMGVVLFFGAVFTLAMNLLVFKFLMWMLTNSTNLQNNYKLFNIDGDKVPNLMSVDTKPAYVAPYENIDFTKRKKLSGIILGALSVAALAVITVFGIVDPNNSPLNVTKATSDTTVVYTTLVADNPFIEDETSFKNYALDGVEISEGVTLKLDAVDVEKKEVSVYEYYDSEPETHETLFFVTKIDSSVIPDAEYFKASIEDKIEQSLSLSSYEINVKVVTSKELMYSPNQASLMLATGISIVGVALYCAFRFGPSRGIAVLGSTLGTTAISYGIFVGTRIGTSAVTSVAMPLVAVTTMLATLFYLASEKSAFKDSREELTPEVRKELIVKSISKAASPMLVFALVTVYVAINFFGFGAEQTALLFASVLIGDLVGIIAILTVFGPFAEVISSGLKKIKLPKFKFMEKDKAKANVRKNSSEPEETIFIGIND